uniref:Uncharacterized protein n=1 Tax=Amphimedon queenslandica TaxID=400682 RepID=A0A1X7VRU0_AMPQE
EYSHPLTIPVFLNFAFRSQGACPSIAMKTESQSIRTRYGGITHSVVMLQLECG